MAFLEVQFHAESLAYETSVYVLLPEVSLGIGLEGHAAQDGQPYPVLWLLHGMSDDHTIWMRRTAIERYVSQMGIAVVMPAVSFSRYTNMLHGPQYYDYIVDELPRIMSRLFPRLSTAREDNYIAGLSMGGGGAMRIGLLNPNRYARICMLSTGGVIPLEKYWRQQSDDPHEYETSPAYRRLRDIYGVGDVNTLEGTDHDIIKLIHDTAQNKETLPRVFHAMGTEDNRHIVAMKIKEAFEAIPGNPYQYEYHEGPGAHEWDFWDRWILAFLRTLPGANAEVK